MKRINLRRKTISREKTFRVNPDQNMIAGNLCIVRIPAIAVFVKQFLNGYFFADGNDLLFLRKYDTIQLM